MVRGVDLLEMQRGWTAQWADLEAQVPSLTLYSFLITPDVIPRYRAGSITQVTGHHPKTKSKQTKKIHRRLLALKVGVVNETLVQIPYNSYGHRQGLCLSTEPGTALNTPGVAPKQIISLKKLK